MITKSTSTTRTDWISVERIPSFIGALSSGGVVLSLSGSIPTLYCAQFSRVNPADLPKRYRPAIHSLERFTLEAGSRVGKKPELFHEIRLRIFDYTLILKGLLPSSISACGDTCDCARDPAHRRRTMQAIASAVLSLPSLPLRPVPFALIDGSADFSSSPQLPVARHVPSGQSSMCSEISPGTLTQSHVWTNRPVDAQHSSLYVSNHHAGPFIGAPGPIFAKLDRSTAAFSPGTACGLDIHGPFLALSFSKTDAFRRVGDVNGR